MKWHHVLCCCCGHVFVAMCVCVSFLFFLFVRVYVCQLVMLVHSPLVGCPLVPSLFSVVSIEVRWLCSWLRLWNCGKSSWVHSVFGIAANISWQMCTHPSLLVIAALSSALSFIAWGASMSFFRWGILEWVDKMIVASVDQKAHWLTHQSVDEHYNIHSVNIHEMLVMAWNKWLLYRHRYGSVVHWSNPHSQHHASHWSTCSLSGTTSCRQRPRSRAP